MNVLDEGAIKHALIRHLHTSGKLENATLINEFVVGNWSRRVDLVLANGRLCAYEVKSELDSLRRLPGQITTYLKYFDKVSVVTVPKFVRSVKDIVPPQVEILLAEYDGDSIAVTVARRGKANNVQDLKALASLLRKDELQKVLSNENSDFSAGQSRTKLTSRFLRLSVAFARRATLATIQRRYAASNQRFAQTWEQTDSASLELLSRFKKRAVPAIGDDLPSDPHVRKIDLAKFEVRWGSFPEDMPKTIRLRKPSEL